MAARRRRTEMDVRLRPDGRTAAGYWDQTGRLRGAAVVSNEDELMVCEDWQEQPSGSLRALTQSETFPLASSLASPEARAVQSALVNDTSLLTIHPPRG